MNKKIMMSGLSIISALALLGGTAFAAFTTTATATGNTFSTDNPSLLITTTAGPGTSEPGFTVSGLIPGGSSSPQAFDLVNNGLNPLSVNAQFTITNGATTPIVDDMSITISCTNGFTATETHPVSYWTSGTVPLGTLNPSGTANCTMTGSLANGVGNPDANKTVIFDAVFGGSEGT